MKTITTYLAIVLIVCGIGAAIFGSFATQQAADSSQQAMWWNGKLHMRRVAILEPEESTYSSQPTQVDIAEAEQQVNEFLSKSAYFSALGSQFLGLSGIMISVGAVLISITGLPSLKKAP
ncbi:MAG: hypothetical protein NT028_11740 [candidate division Zixibacteria bacterium]|nr:hypothetical protein [candidate division Zixibacteria bacterium]